MLDAQPLALTDCESVGALVSPDHLAGLVEDLSGALAQRALQEAAGVAVGHEADVVAVGLGRHAQTAGLGLGSHLVLGRVLPQREQRDRKSTRLNSSHVAI